MAFIFQHDLRHHGFWIAGAVAGWIALALPACGSSGATPGTGGLSGTGAGQGSDSCDAFKAKEEGCGVPANEVGCPPPCETSCFDAASCEELLATMSGPPTGTLAACIAACSSVAGTTSTGAGVGGGASTGPSTSTSTTSSSGSPSSGSGSAAPNCDALAACCPSLPDPSEVTACNNEASYGNDADCAGALMGWQSLGYCG